MSWSTSGRSLRATRHVGAVCAVALLAACGLPLKPAPGLLIPGPEVRALIETICLSPLGVTFDFPDRTAKFAALEEEIRAALASGGFAVVPSDAVAEVFRQVNEREGGHFDPHFGWRDEAKWQRVRAQVYAELETRHACDAVLIPSVAIVVAPWANGTASWDGVEDTVSSGWRSLGTWGRVPALSLWVSVRDMRHREVYFHTGGIQVVQQLREGFLRSTFEFIAESDLLADPSRNRAAVRASLQDLLATRGR
jgi:hypothetical protein